MALCWQSSETGSAWAARNILKRVRHMCFRKKIEVFHNKTGQSEIQVLYKILIKNWFYPSTCIYNMFPRWISYLSIIQTKNVNETNKALKNGTEAKMCVNTRWLWWKQGGQGKPPLSKCLLLENWMEQFIDYSLCNNTVSGTFQNSSRCNNTNRSIRIHHHSVMWMVLLLQVSQVISFQTLIIHGTPTHHSRHAVPQTLSKPTLLAVTTPSLCDALCIQGHQLYRVTQMPDHGTEFSVLYPRDQSILMNKEGCCLQQQTPFPWRGSDHHSSDGRESEAITQNWMEIHMKKKHNLHIDQAKRKIAVPLCCHPNKSSLRIREFFSEDKQGINCMSLAVQHR